MQIQTTAGHRDLVLLVKKKKRLMMHSDVENSEEKEPVEDSEGKRSRAFSWVYTRVYEDFWVSL